VRRGERDNRERERSRALMHVCLCAGVYEHAWVFVSE
jgi:hypothetical protein